MKTSPRDTTSLPPGFDWLLDQNSGRHLALPSRVVDAVEDERARQAEAEKATQRADARAPLHPALAPARTPNKTTLVDELMALARAARKPRHAVALFSLEDLQAQVQRLGEQADREQREAHATVLRTVAQRGPWRVVRRDSKAAQALQALDTAMPHLAAATRQVRNRLRLAQTTGRPPRIAPMLLVGPPGVGKSHFAERLAQALGVPVHRVAMDSTQTASALAGSESHWINSQVGVVFKALAQGEVANPVILLDEIDKAQHHSGHNPLAPLHTLLEPLTAQHFIDRCMQLPLDARHIVWIATANDLEALDPPLRSRFAVHAIPPPDAAQGLALAGVIARALLQELGLKLAVPEAVLQRLALHAPRAQRQLLEDAIAEAVARGADSLCAADIPEAVKPTRRPIGFVAAS